MREKKTDFNLVNLGNYDTDIMKLQGSLLRYCLVLTGSHEDAEDLSQDTWLRAISNGMVWSHVNPEAFLLRIAKNRWVDVCRRKKLLSERLSGLSQLGTEKESGTLEIENMFQSLLHYQSPLQRTVFILREVMGYSIAETSIMLEITEGAVKSALYRARLTLAEIRRELEKEDLGIPEAAEQRELLQELAFAYEQGDIGTLIQLLHPNQADPVVITAIGFNLQTSTASAMYKNHSSISMQMCA